MPHILLDKDIAGAIEGLLANLADHPELSASDLARQLHRHINTAIATPVPADVCALASVCSGTLDALKRRSSINDRGDFIVEATASERDDDVEGIQIISEINALSAYLAHVADSGDATSPVADLIRHAADMKDVLDELHSNMDALGFYASDDDGAQVNGGDTVDVLNALAARIKSVLTAAPPPDTTVQEDAIEALADLHGGVWGEHPDLPVEDWQLQVEDDNTRKGYWKWVADELEAIAADDEATHAPPPVASPSSAPGL